jgi:hypothetical protein
MTRVGLARIELAMSVQIIAAASALVTAVATERGVRAATMRGEMRAAVARRGPPARVTLELANLVHAWRPDAPLAAVAMAAKVVFTQGVFERSPPAPPG